MFHPCPDAVALAAPRPARALYSVLRVVPTCAPASRAQHAARYRKIPLPGSATAVERRYSRGLENKQLSFSAAVLARSVYRTHTRTVLTCPTLSHIVQPFN